MWLVQGGYDLKALADATADSFGGILGLPTVDTHNPVLLRDEPLDKVHAVLDEACNIHGL